MTTLDAYVCKCGVKLDENLECPACKIKYEKGTDGKSAPVLP